MLLKTALLADRRHGFTLRTGGVSAAPFDTLNLGRGLGDADDAVAENHRRVAEALGYEVLYEQSQVHGTRIREVRADEDHVAVRQEEGDALIATEPGVAVGVRVADCAPVLLASAAVVAAVHAGWRGVEAGIVAKVIARMQQLGATGIRAAIGPHIRSDAFEVGEDVAERLRAAMPGEGDPVILREPRPHVDLTRILRAQLAAAGVDEVEDVGGCTLSEPERFFSYRRDGETGRHLAVIVC